MTPQMATWGPNPSGRGCLSPNPASHLLAVSYFNTGFVGAPWLDARQPTSQP